MTESVPEDLSRQHATTSPFSVRNLGVLRHLKPLGVLELYPPRTPRMTVFESPVTHNKEWPHLEKFQIASEDQWWGEIRRILSKTQNNNTFN